MTAQISLQEAIACGLFYILAVTLSTFARTERFWSKTFRWRPLRIVGIDRLRFYLDRYTRSDFEPGFFFETIDRTPSLPTTTNRSAWAGPHTSDNRTICTNLFIVCTYSIIFVSTQTSPSSSPQNHKKTPPGLRRGLFWSGFAGTRTPDLRLWSIIAVELRVNLWVGVLCALNLYK